MIQNGIHILPSVASADPLNLNAALARVRESGCTDLHIDIEDGNFIPNITFGTKTVNALRAATDLPFSFHLMTAHWEEWTRYAAKNRASIVFAHFETLAYPLRFVSLARQLGIRCGIAFNPKTPVSDAEYVLHKLDGVLLLSVEPDGAGEGFLTDTYKKCAAVRAMAPNIEIWVDGAVTFDILDPLHKSGVTHAVMGREFFK